MTLRIIIKRSCIHFKYRLIATPMWAMISPCGHPKETFLASPLEVGVEISQVTRFAKCTGAKHLRVTASATWLQNCCWLWCSCSSVSVREVSCIYDTELDIATHLLWLCKLFHLLMLQHCWGNSQRRSSFRKWERSAHQSVFLKIAAQKLARWRK